jgi:glutathione S-transferase
MVSSLITVPFSHFCEKARWCLDAAGVVYREEGHVPVLHRLAVRRAGGGGTSVPVLALPDGTVLADSPLIVRFADASAPPQRKLLPEDAGLRDAAIRFERHLDIDFAPHVRRFAYFHLLSSRGRTLRLFDRQTPRYEQLVARAVFPILRAMMRKFMSIDDARATRSRDHVRRVFEEVSSLVDGRQYVFGDRLGLADIAFAAFAAPVLFPSEHPIVPPLAEPANEIPPLYENEVRALRETPAGQFALRLYREHRRRRHTPVAGAERSHANDSRSITRG